MHPPIPPNEEERLRVLGSYRALDADSEQALDDLVRLASTITGASIAAVTLIDRDRQWLCSRVGTDVREIPRSESFCAHAILEPDRPLYVPNTELDERFAHHPQVVQEGGIRFYYGVPLVSESGHPLGTFCVADSQPRELDPEHAEALRILARQAMTELELRRKVRDLEKARLEADAASDAKAAFLSNISHEIRTPMNGILGVTALLEGTNLDAQQSGYLQTIESSANALLKLLTQIVEVARMDLGRLELRNQRFPILQLVQEAHAMVEPTARAKGLELSMRVNLNGRTHVLGDRLRIQQVLLQLLDNAIRFTPTGSIEILVEAREGRLRFTVADTGIGMTPEFQERVFLPFEQADSSTTRQEPGAGIGMALVHRLVTTMEGTMGVESRLGEGTRIWFDLPLGPDLNVLVVDDNKVNAMVLSTLLERNCCRVSVAEGGQEAIQKARNEDYDIIFMDIQVPGTDGIEATRAIRYLKNRSALASIVAVTSGSVDHLREEVAGAGLDKVLCKPVQESLILDVLELAASLR